jgi:3-oxoacyl-[acyl-carrier protein] reductase
MTTRTYLLAGCTSGIGFETLKLLRTSGNRVIAAVRNREPLSDLADLEVVDFEAQKEMVQLTLPEALDGLVYFPGTINLKPFRGFKDADFHRDLEINFMGAVRLIRAALPALQKAESSSVVLFSSVAAQTGMPFHTSIAAAKGAVEGFTRALAAELAPRVRVNCIAPSLTDTPLAAQFLNTDAKQELSRQRHPAKRIGDPADIAQLVQMLLGDASKFITGQILPVDGGLSSLRLL